jgi:MFS family permease
MKRAGRLITKGISTNVLVLGIVSLLTDMSSEMIYPILPLFLTAIGATGLIIGLIEGAAETTASLLKVVSGWHSDRSGSRKPYILSGYGLSSLVKPFLVVATMPYQVLAIRITERVGKGLRSAPRDALIADSTEAAYMGRAFGFHKAMDSLGAVIGPIIALVVILFVATSDAMETYRLIFVIAIIPAFAAVPFIAFVKERNRDRKAKTSTFLADLRCLGRPFWILIAIVVVFYAGEISYAFFILKAEAQGLSLAETIVLYILFNLVFVLVAIPSGSLSDRMGRRPVILASFGLFALTCVIMAGAESLLLLIMGFVLFGVYKGSSEGVLKAFVVDVVPIGLRATALGAFHTSVGLVMLPGGIIAGLLWDTYGPWATFAFGAGAALLATVMLLISGTSPRKSRGDLVAAK